MAVIAVWQCDRDGSMFEDKKLAEEHDKYLELAANITTLIEQEIPDINEKHSEAIGLLLAGRRDQLARACKGKPEELLEAAIPASDALTLKPSSTKSDIKIPDLNLKMPDLNLKMPDLKKSHGLKTIETESSDPLTSRVLNA